MVSTRSTAQNRVPRASQRISSIPPEPITVGTMLRIFNPASGPSLVTSAGWIPEARGAVGADGFRAITPPEAPARGFADGPVAPWVDAAAGVAEDSGVGVGAGAEVGRGVAVGAGVGVGIGVGVGAAVGVGVGAGADPPQVGY